jgi:hypothetical protein
MQLHRLPIGVGGTTVLVQNRVGKLFLGQVPNFCNRDFENRSRAQRK